MPARKRRSSKGQVKPKEKALKKPVLDFSDLVHKGIQNEPLGKAISALNILYSELDDMEMRMNILISRIEILKTRTKWENAFIANITERYFTRKITRFCI